MKIYIFRRYSKHLKIKIKYIHPSVYILGILVCPAVMILTERILITVIDYHYSLCVLFLLLYYYTLLTLLCLRTIMTRNMSVIHRTLARKLSFSRPS